MGKTGIKPHGARSGGFSKTLPEALESAGLVELQRRCSPIQGVEFRIPRILNSGYKKADGKPNSSGVFEFGWRIENTMPNPIPFPGRYSPNRHSLFTADRAWHYGSLGI
jgi:hypothetical protein